MAKARRSRKQEPTQGGAREGSGRPAEFRPKTEQFVIRFTAEGFGRMESARGDRSRADYLEGLVRGRAAGRGKAGAANA